MKRITDILLLVVLLLQFVSCQRLPSYSLSGDVRKVAIEDVKPVTLIQVQTGDEIRWTNMRATVVRITFLDYVLDKVACRNNFGGHFSSGADTILQPHESASLCFNEPAILRYVMRAHSGLPDGDIAESGEVQIGAFSDHRLTQTEPVLIDPP